MSKILKTLEGRRLIKAVRSVQNGNKKARQRRISAPEQGWLEAVAGIGVEGVGLLLSVVGAVYLGSRLVCTRTLQLLFATFDVSNVNV